MRKICLVCACLVCVSSGRRTKSSTIVQALGNDREAETTDAISNSSFFPYVPFRPQQVGWRTQQGSRQPSNLYMAKTPLTANGKRIEVPAGSSMMAACKKLGLKVPTNCKKGDCGTCMVTV